MTLDSTELRATPVVDDYVSCLAVLPCALLAVACSSPQALPPTKPHAPRNSHSTHLLVARLVDCASVKPIIFQEVLPDGSVLEASDPTASEGVTLVLELHNPNGAPVFVETCAGVPRALLQSGTAPDCHSPDVVGLAPTDSVRFVYTLRPVASDAAATITTIAVRAGRRPERVWWNQLPGRIVFETGSRGCKLK